MGKALVRHKSKRSIKRLKYRGQLWHIAPEKAWEPRGLKKIKILLWPGIKSQRLTGDLAAIFRLTSSKSKSPVASIKRYNNNSFPDCLRFGLQRQNRAARQRCLAVLLHQLERLTHAHEAQVCAGNSSCEDDGARQRISWSVYRSACPIGLKRKGVRLNYEEFVLRNTAVTNRQYNYATISYT